MHGAEKVRDTTLDDENTSQHVMSSLVTMLGNQPEAFTSDLGDDQLHYLLSLCTFNALKGELNVDKK